MNKHFTTAVVCDFEYETSGGEFNLVAGDLPKVLCMVAHVLNENLQHVRTIKLWRGEFGTAPPFDIDDDTLFVAYSAWAELTCFMTLNWEFPKHVFDLHTAFLAASNLLLPYDPDAVRKRQKKGLRDACRAFGIEGWGGKASTRGRSPRTSAKGAGNFTGVRPSSTIARRTFGNRRSC
jgi:hypothetical protein